MYYLTRTSDWKIENDRLYVHKPNPSKDPLIQDLDAWKLVVPEEIRQKVLSEIHDSPHSGHLGRTKTLELAKKTYFWPGMRLDVVRYVRKCEICQKIKARQTGPQGLMCPKNYEQPWHVVCADIMRQRTRAKINIC